MFWNILEKLLRPSFSSSACCSLIACKDRLIEIIEIIEAMSMRSWCSVNWTVVMTFSVATSVLVQRRNVSTIRQTHPTLFKIFPHITKPIIFGKPPAFYFQTGRGLLTSISHLQQWLIIASWLSTINLPLMNHYYTTMEIHRLLITFQVSLVCSVFFSSMSAVGALYCRLVDQLVAKNCASPACYSLVTRKLVG